MKRILTILAATLLLTAAMAGTASASSYDSIAEELSARGIVRHRRIPGHRRRL